MSLTPLDKNAIRSSFNRAANRYDHYAALQHEVESRLLERIEFQRLDPGVILDLGCGTGTASRSLADRFSQANIIALDWAYAMLERVRSGAGEGSIRRLSRVCADMHELPLASHCAELVFSNLTLQWACDIPAVFCEFRRIMKPGSMLVFTCYGPDTLQELKKAWRRVDDLPHVNDYPDMHDIGDELQRAGFSEPVMDAERLTLEYPDVLSIMREIKGMGAHNVAQGRFRGLTGKKRLQAVLQAYEEFRRGDRYPASFEVIYGTAYAPAEGQPMKTPEGDFATFSVDALRSDFKKRESS